MMDFSSKHTVIAIIVLVSSMLSAYFSHTILSVILILIATFLWYTSRYINVERGRSYLEYILNATRLPTNIRQRILDLIPIPDKESVAPPIRSVHYSSSMMRFAASTSSISTPETDVNMSQPLIRNDQILPAANSRGGNFGAERGNLSLATSYSQSSPQFNHSHLIPPFKKPGNSFAAPRDRPVGVKTCHAVAGPTLASTRFKQNLDYCVYADVNSPGFSQRIASYHQEANSETPSSGYTTPGQFPSVKLTKDNVHIVTMKNRPKPYIPITVRIAPPVTEYTSPSRFERPREEEPKTPTQSVLDALKEISRKRIHGEVEENDPNKRYKSDALDISSNEDLSNTAAETNSKRGCEGRDSPEKRTSTSMLPFAKRLCSNEIESSLSSTQRVQDKKRKASAAMTSPSPSLPTNKKRMSLSVLDVDYDLTSDASSSNTKETTNASRQASRQEIQDSSNKEKKSKPIPEEETPLTPVAESCEPLRPLFGKPTSPEIDSSHKEKRSPVFATMQTEETSAAEQNSRQLRQKKLQSLFNAIKKDEEAGTTGSTSGINTTKEIVLNSPAASLVSSTTLTTAITSPVVSTAQQDSLPKFGINIADNISQKSNPTASVSSFSRPLQFEVESNSSTKSPVSTKNDALSNQKIGENNSTLQFGTSGTTSVTPSYTFGVTTNSATKPVSETANVITDTTGQSSVVSTESPFASALGTSANPLISSQLSQSATVSPSVTFGITTTTVTSPTSSLITNFQLPTVSTPTGINFMNALTPTSKPAPTLSGFSQATSSAGFSIPSSGTPSTPKFSNLSFGASTAASFASPSSINTTVNTFVSDAAPPAYLSLPTNTTSSVSTNSPLTFVNTTATSTSGLPPFSTTSSALPSLNTTSLPFGSSSAPPPYGSTTVPATSSSGAFGVSNLSFTNNNSEQSTFGVANKSLDNQNTAAPTFGNTTLPFSTSASIASAFVAPNVHGSTSASFNSLGLSVESGSLHGSSPFGATQNSKPSGFVPDTFNFGNQKQPDAANTFASPSFGSNTAVNLPQFPQVPTSNSSGFGFGTPSTASVNAFPMTVPSTAASGGMFQFGQSATTNAPSTYGQTATTNTSSTFGQNTVNSFAQFGQTATSTAFGSTATNTAPAFGSTATSTAPTFGSTATNTAPTFGSTATNTAPAFGSTATNTAPAFGSTATNTAPAFGSTATNTAPAFGQNASSTNFTPFSQSTSSPSVPFGQTTINPSVPFGQPAANTSVPFGQPASSPSAPFGQNAANNSNKTLFGGFTFGDPQPTTATNTSTTEFSSGNSKPIFANIFGAPPNQSPFQQTHQNISTTSNTMPGFATSTNAIGGFSFPLNTTAAAVTTNANTASFGFGNARPADGSGFNFNLPSTKPPDAFGFSSSPQTTFAFGGQQQQAQPFGVDPNANPSAFSMGQGVQGVNSGHFQFNAGTAPTQPSGVFNFGTVPPAAGSNFTQFGPTTNITSPFNFAAGGGMFSIGAGAANRPRPGAMRRRKPNS